MTDKSQAAPANPVPGPQSTKTVAPATNVDKDEAAEKKAQAEAEKIKAEALAAGSKDDEKALEKVLDADAEKHPEPILERDDEPAWYAEGRAAITKLRRLVSLIPRETPDEHKVWGAAGISLTLGDLRALAREA